MSDHLDAAAMVRDEAEPLVCLATSPIDQDGPPPQSLSDMPSHVI